MITQNKNTCVRALKIALLGLVLSTTACGVAPKHNATVSIDPTFTEYVARFEDAAHQAGHKVRVNDLIVAFGDTGSNTETRGLCAFAEGETPAVTINQQAWDSSTDDEREELIFHELGHCLLGLKHVAGINTDGIPASIMNPVEITSAIYAQNRAYYLHTLFDGEAK